ncbi:hypothetical protein [Kitasatospora sp. CB01950]|uniref:hypothetical protein n=1 Tax=Kitasatospora sp. CB01950 TaxID=1703930 RepID=UPI00093CC779|nr:hypothetical protein [Kitasatospora sp. CB01950]OKJ01146.1 hypothetical protein AMK19_28970 [Kitasatospora sp. CB01950]
MTALSGLAALGEPALAVADPARRLLAVACADEYGDATTLGLFETGARPRLLRRTDCPYPVHALAFHPSKPLLAVGIGDYDGGYHFEGQLLLLGLDNGTERAMFAHDWGRQVLAAEWLDDTRLRLHLAPHDDYKDDAAHREAHVVVLECPDWVSALGRTVPDDRLRGPRVPFPRPDHRSADHRSADHRSADHRSAARELANRLLDPPDRRHHR